MFRLTGRSDGTDAGLRVARPSDAAVRRLVVVPHADAANVGAACRVDAADSGVADFEAAHLVEAAGADHEAARPAESSPFESSFIFFLLKFKFKSFN